MAGDRGANSHEIAAGINTFFLQQAASLLRKQHPEGANLLSSLAVLLNEHKRETSTWGDIARKGLIPAQHLAALQKFHREIAGAVAEYVEDLAAANPHARTTPRDNRTPTLQELSFYMSTILPGLLCRFFEAAAPAIAATQIEQQYKRAHDQAAAWIRLLMNSPLTHPQEPTIVFKGDKTLLDGLSSIAELLKRFIQGDSFADIAPYAKPPAAAREVFISAPAYIEEAMWFLSYLGEYNVTHESLPAPGTISAHLAGYGDVLRRLLVLSLSNSKGIHFLANRLMEDIDHEETLFRLVNALGAEVKLRHSENSNWRLYRYGGEAMTRRIEALHETSLALTEALQFLAEDPGNILYLSPRMVEGLGRATALCLETPATAGKANFGIPALGAFHGAVALLLETMVSAAAREALDELATAALDTFIFPGDKKSDIPAAAMRRDALIDALGLLADGHALFRFTTKGVITPVDEKQLRLLLQMKSLAPERWAASQQLGALLELAVQPVWEALLAAAQNNTRNGHDKTAGTPGGTPPFLPPGDTPPGGKLPGGMAR